MNSDMMVEVENLKRSLIPNIENVVNSPRGQQLIQTGAGLIEKRGDRNYVVAVVTAEALGKLSNTRPIVTELPEGRYKVSWQGQELTKAQAYVLKVATEAMKNDGEPSPVVVELFPLVRPLALKYGAPVLIGSGLAVFGLGYLIGKSK